MLIQVSLLLSMRMQVFTGTTAWNLRTFHDVLHFCELLCLIMAFLKKFFKYWVIDNEDAVVMIDMDHIWLLGMQNHRCGYARSSGIPETGAYRTFAGYFSPTSKHMLASKRPVVDGRQCVEKVMRVFHRKAFGKDLQPHRLEFTFWFMGRHREQAVSQFDTLHLCRHSNETTESAWSMTLNSCVDTLVAVCFSACCNHGELAQPSNSSPAQLVRRGWQLAHIDFWTYKQYD